ncbi:MAG: acyltransferase [Flavobacteriales bacterium]|nr:acyltransferase [Flavobacteriales bacterium]MBK7241122.1 acyltransferase [Flavobacteriales bacterium]MBK7295731.1 acyltransferase [Flavobacteriales bacterium]MBK9534386.1 acyltransferase [Flavobacteriales bacterium]MBP9137190.1 acyltransferase [Flavobacteriales bacterium]
MAVVPQAHLAGRRWQYVDVLRGIAVILVILHHHAAGGIIGEYGWLGVDLFFVLSGFLVSGLIFDEYRRTNGFAGVRFLIRRGFKIYPSFYALIIVSALLMEVIGSRDPLMNYIAELFFFQNYHAGLWSHTWSLAVEEHFYLLLVFAAVVLMALPSRIKWRGMIVLSALLFLFFLALRIYTYQTIPYHVTTHFIPSHLRMDSLLGGVLLSAWHRFRPVSFKALFGRNSIVLIACMALFLAPVLFFRFGSTVMGTIGLSGAFLAGAIAVGMAVSRTPLPETSGIQRYIISPLAWVGGISYNTYLWHLLVLLVVEKVMVKFSLGGSILELMFFAAGSFLVGSIVTRFIEIPFLRMREKWYPKQSRSVK